MSSIDRVAPLRFLRTEYEPEDWVAILVKSHQSQQTTHRVGPVSLISDARFQGWLRWRNLLHGDVYVSVNALTPGQRRRTRETVAAIRHIFLDVDHDGSQTLARIAERPDLPEPSCILQSSPDRFHVLWRVSGFRADDAERLQKQLAAELGTDRAATSRAQLTRAPGFVNHKRGQHVVTAEYEEMTCVYTPADFPSPTLVQPRMAPASRDRVIPSELTVFERARRYLSSLPPAVMGQGGDVRTFRVCCRLVRGFALTDTEAFEVLAEWNRRCEPPWSDPELRDKLRRARRYGREPIGGLVQPETCVGIPTPRLR
jgi:hypothetical protein